MAKPSFIGTGPKKSTSEKADAAELRMGKAGRIVSLSDFQKLTGYDRGTISRWIKNGCPTERVGGKGEAVLVDVRDVMNWREEQARAEVRREMATGADDEGVDVDRELKLEQIKFQKVKTATLTGTLVLAPAAEQVIAVAINGFRTAIAGLDVRIERDLVGFPADIVRKAKTDIRDNCHSALRQAQQAMEKGIRLLTKQRLTEIGAEIDVFDEEEETDGDDE